jgi:hypothetical protein
MSCFKEAYHVDESQSFMDRFPVSSPILACVPSAVLSDQAALLSWLILNIPLTRHGLLTLELIPLHYFSTSPIPEKQQWTLCKLHWPDEPISLFGTQSQLLNPEKSPESNSPVLKTFSQPD